jgi:hypothetical protein
VFVVSTVLFTVVFLWATPIFLADALTWRRSMFQETDQLWVSNYLAPVGFASLAIILIGLIVAWTGYINRIRWAWLVMFIIVWVWAFPVMILPILQHRNGISLTEWFQTAMRVSSLYRDLAVTVLMFSLLVVVLILPIKSLSSDDRQPEAMLNQGSDPRRDDSEFGDILVKFR